MSKKPRVDGICPQCGERERQVFSTGRVASYCRECTAERQAKYLKQSKEKVAEQCKRYREQNREKLAAKDREYYKQNREKKREYSKRHYRRNRGKALEYAKGYYKQNKLKEPIVYFIQIGNYIKIGSVSSTKREALARVMKGNPVPSHYLFDLPGGKDRENEIHEFFRDQNVTDPNRGGRELFEIRDELEYFLKAYLVGTDEEAHDAFVRRLEHARLHPAIPEDYSGWYTFSQVNNLGDIISKCSTINLKINSN